MIKRSLIAIIIFLSSCQERNDRRKVFDVHLHGAAVPGQQLDALTANDVHAIAISTSWPQQQAYQSGPQINVLHGLLLPCPGGRVPYSRQPCFEDGREWPSVAWVERQIKAGRIDFIGEVLTQYQGISMSDTLMYPFYALAVQYGLPVGIHTGSAGPDHGCPGFKEDMGNPALLKETLQRFPELKVWLMHGGGPYIKECIEIMKTHPGVYTDISVLNNPGIVPEKEFRTIMRSFIDAGLEDRLLFGSDNADISTSIEAVERLAFLSGKQKEKIFYLNAASFFKSK
ncbi:amidohydrolase family protein [Niabella aurantiaca]|uniref:amidohydrolase family protein n=1 Tax=Niabella aurantiaca TaxID=379900 RepID=UPI00036C3A93|nr:amidohydrolase family protein [Niabella aurantiaca]